MQIKIIHFHIFDFVEKHKGILKLNLKACIRLNIYIENYFTLDGAFQKISLV